MNPALVKPGSVKLLVVNNEKYHKSILALARQLALKKPLCYVTINKECGAINDQFRGLDVFYIDCLSRTIHPSQQQKNCVFISSPYALTELSISITERMGPRCQIILLDSLTTLLIYHQPNGLLKFVHSLANQIRNSKESCLLLAISSSDKGSKFFNDLSTIIDEIDEI